VEIGVDDEYVAVLSEARDAVVYRAEDGAEVARQPIPDPHQWLGLSPTRLATVRWQQGDLRVAVTNLLTGELQWEQSFPRGTRQTITPDELLVSVTPTGAGDVRRLSDGHRLWTMMLPQPDPLTYVWTQRQGRTWWVFAGDASGLVDGRVILPYDGSHYTPFRGTVSRVEAPEAFADDGATAGTVVWTTPVDAAAIDLLQPASLPVVLFTARVNLPAEAGGRGPFVEQRVAATVLDRQTGDVVYSTYESQATGNPQWEIDGDRGQLVINYVNWLLELTITPPGPPK
jgi:hypothetical protein